MRLTKVGIGAIISSGVEEWRLDLKPLMYYQSNMGTWFGYFDGKTGLPTNTYTNYWTDLTQYITGRY